MRMPEIKAFWRKPESVTALAAARRRQERSAALGLGIFAAFPLILVAAILVALVMRSWPIMQTQPVWDLLTGLDWHPAKGQFGFLPFIVGTFWVTILSLVLAVPPCLLAAIYLAEYARPLTRNIVKPLIDLLAAIPSVVYGVWGVLTVVPWVQDGLAPAAGKLFPGVALFEKTNPTGYGIAAGGIVLAVMIAPFIIAISYEVLHTVPQGLRHSSLALGATRWQTIRSAVLPKALPGILAGVVLGASRALGETMAVLMVVGNVAKIPTSIFDPAYPLPALIANNYGEMLSIPLYDSALLGAALILLLIVLVFNICSTLVLRHVIGRPA